jgi:hypothetical protein
MRPSNTRLLVRAAPSNVRLSHAWRLVACGSSHARPFVHALQNARLFVRSAHRKHDPRPHSSSNAQLFVRSTLCAFDSSCMLPSHARPFVRAAHRMHDPRPHSSSNAQFFVRAALRACGSSHAQPLARTALRPCSSRMHGSSNLRRVLRAAGRMCALVRTPFRTHGSSHRQPSCAEPPSTYGVRARARVERKKRKAPPDPGGPPTASLLADTDRTRGRGLVVDRWGGLWTSRRGDGGAVRRGWLCLGSR